MAEPFLHKCFELECTNEVQYDDEPWCFEHSPDEGSHVEGFSALRHLQAERAAGERLDIQQVIDVAKETEAHLERRSEEVIEARTPEEVPDERGRANDPGRKGERPGKPD